MGITPITPLVPSPSMHIPIDEQFFKTEKGKSDIAYLKDHLYREGSVIEEHAHYIIEKPTEIFHTESNLLHIDAPAKISETFAANTYLLGDYVNRGYFDIEYSERLYDAFMNSVCALPLAALMNKLFFCVHGPGMGGFLLSSARWMTFRTSDLTSLPLSWIAFTSHRLGLRTQCDILLFDPVKDFGQEKRPENFVDNDAACTFLERNRLLSIIRSHQAQDDMYRLFPWGQWLTVMTVFSAPNYLDVYNNKRAIFQYEPNMLRIRQFNGTRQILAAQLHGCVYLEPAVFFSEKKSKYLLFIFIAASPTDHSWRTRTRSPWSSISSAAEQAAEN
ncbi:Metallo-dependent phosphatase-like protein [Russula emetica]|nr:Metallo-dependent phosphatase-like protein [Russula emetica]